MLSRLNSHPRDGDIEFHDYYEGREHVYIIKGGNKPPTSVTTLIHHYFEEFNADKIINQHYARWQRDEKNKYYGKTKKQIKQMWHDNGLDARTLGSAMHKSIEDFFNKELSSDPDTTEFKYFMNFWNDFLDINPEYKPYRTEWTIFTDNKLVSGSIDMVMEGENGELIILDWKRSKEIKRTNEYGRTGSGELSHLDDCNYIHYCLQLNVYRVILQEFYGKKVIDLFLVILHPDNENYDMIRVPFMENEARLIINSAH